MEKIDFRKEGIPFTQVANSVLNDKSLSLKAKGLYGYLYSKPEGWDFNYIRIAEDTVETKNTVLKVIHELEQSGLLKRTRLSTGRVVYQLCIEPLTNNRVEGLNTPLTKKASDQKSLRPNIGQISNKDIKVIKSISNKDSCTQQADVQEVVSLIDSFKEVNPSYGRWFANKTQRAAISRLIEIHGAEQVKKVVAILPKTNTIPYIPTITTPVQLEDKWAQLESCLQKKKIELEAKKIKII